jgi:alpha-galactosidase
MDGYLLFGNEVAILHPFGHTQFYRHGFHSWSLTSWIPLDVRLPRPGIGRLWPQVDHPSLMADYPFAGSGVGALQGSDGKILLLGALELDAVVTGDRWTLIGMIEPASCEAVPSEFEPEKPSPAWLLTYGEEDEVFGHYAVRLADLRGSFKQPVSPRVWCSWYSYYTRITQDELIGVLKSLSGLPFDVFQVDDGWQICMGDWEANEKFPNGMARLAKEVSDCGLKPGLWLAPSIVQPSSSLLQSHPEWLLRDAKGDMVIAGYNWGNVFYALDTTHPAVLEWLVDLIKKVCS